MNEQTDYVIIGAGICGLSIALGLLRNGKTVQILEARDRIGGRIHTLRTPEGFLIEAGAEFIHGQLPLTEALMEATGDTVQDEQGEFYYSEHGTIVEPDDFFGAQARVTEALQGLQEDMSLLEFLHQHFNRSEDQELRDNILRFVEGYDAAEADKISALSVREEWSDGSTTATYRPAHGYGDLLDYLYTAILQQGGRVELNCCVKTINWESGRVDIVSEDRRRYVGSKAVITVPLGVLQSQAGEKAHIEFQPAIPRHLKAASEIGYGPVIKISLLFRDRFWADARFSTQAAQIPDLGFLVSDQPAPVWWTRDLQTPFISAWIGGPKAAALKDKTDAALLNLAIGSLAVVLQTSEALIREQLQSGYVFNWAADPFSRGAYSYPTLGTAQARKSLLTPIDHTLYFAGEGLNEHGSTGTVEAALASAHYFLREKKE